MKKNHLYILVTAAMMCVMMSCANKQQEQQEQQKIRIEDLPLRQTIHNRLAAIDTVPVLPEGLTEEEQVIYVEDLVLTSPITVEELLALTPIHDLDPNTGWYGGDWPEAYMEKVRMANRFMRMQYIALGDPMDEMRWVEAVQTILAEYAATHGISVAQALDSLSDGVAHLEAGTQYEMNQWTYVLASVEYYKTLAAYKTIIDDMPEYKKEMFTQEYVAWNMMNKARHKAYVFIRRAGDHYSSLPMEYEAMYSAYVTYRRQLLTLENEIMWTNKTYKRQHPIVKAADWEDYLDTKLYRTAEDEDSTIVNEVDQSVRTWLRARKKIAKNSDSGCHESYDDITNDYYWTIIHEAEPMPERYF